MYLDEQLAITRCAKIGTPQFDAITDLVSRIRKEVITGLSTGEIPFEPRSFDELLGSVQEFTVLQRSNPAFWFPGVRMSRDRDLIEDIAIAEIDRWLACGMKEPALVAFRPKREYRERTGLTGILIRQYRLRGKPDMIVFGPYESPAEAFAIIRRWPECFTSIYGEQAA